MSVGRVEHRPLRTDVAGRGVVRHPYVLSEQGYIDLLVEIGGVVVRADVHHPAVQGVVQHLRFVVGWLYGDAADLAALVPSSFVVLRTAAGTGAKERCQKTAGYQISHLYHVFTIDVAK